MAFTTIERIEREPTTSSVKPSVDKGSFWPTFSMDQELTPFGAWRSDPIWVPPKDTSAELAKSMLKRYGLFSSRDESWAGLVKEHRSKFTQVREFELFESSIRLPKGKVFMTVYEREQFGEISDPIPNCVRTRLEEFLAGPGLQPGVKVYYLKPLCVEVGNDLIFTTREELDEVITEIQNEVFAEYRRLYWAHRPGRYALKAMDASLAVPRKMLRWSLERKKRVIDAYQAKLEFERRKLALKTAEMYRECRTDGCTFNEILALTNPVDRTDVVNQYSAEHEYSDKQRRRLLMASAAALPWFFSIPVSIYFFAKFAAISAAMPIAVCDPAFVAEMPGSKGVLLKIGHFDEINGVTHVEI